MAAASRFAQLALGPILLISLFQVSAAAQPADPPPADSAQFTGSEYGFHMGPFLPNQIDGMTEIQPMWGARYGTSFRKGVLEFSAANSRGNGVVYYTGSVSYRYDAVIEDVIGNICIGIDVHQWSDPTSATRLVAGGHIGGGIMTPIGDNVYFRSEMNFILNPGTGLYIGFGLLFRAPGG